MSANICTSIERICGFHLNSNDSANQLSLRSRYKFELDRTYATLSILIKVSLFIRVCSRSSLTISLNPT